MTDPQFQPQAQNSTQPQFQQQPAVDPYAQVPQQGAPAQQQWGQPGTQGMVPGYGVPGGSLAQQEEGKKLAKRSLIMGIIGLFVFGIILGVVAIMQANKAEKFGVPAKAGKILGVLDIILSILVMVFGRKYAGM